MLIVFASGAAHAQTLPGLHFDPPAGFSGAPSGDPAVYAAPAKDALLHIYPFRPFRGNDAAAEFRDSLFREHLPRQFREAKLTSAPKFESINIGGAAAAYSARFKEGGSERLRVLIVVPGHVALLDFNANGAAAWERSSPAIQAMLRSMRVTNGR